MSANAYLENINEAKKAGVTDYLTKPVQKDQLISLFQHLFASFKPESHPDIQNSRSNCFKSIETRLYEHFYNMFKEKEVSRKLANISIESINDCIKETKIAINKNDNQALRTSLHKLNGALLNSNLIDLSELTSNAHKILKEGQFGIACKIVEKLIEIWESSIQESKIKEDLTEIKQNQ
jgi:YesN/AraC family two-component response regulator